MMNKIKNWPWAWIILLILAFAFVYSIAWSIVFETLLPLWRARQRELFLRNIIGIPIIFAGLGLFIWSAIRFLRDTFKSLNSPEMRILEKEIKLNQCGEPHRSTQNYKFPFLIRAWLPSFLLFLLAFAMFALGGWLIN